MLVVQFMIIILIKHEVFYEATKNKQSSHFLHYLQMDN